MSLEQPVHLLHALEVDLGLALVVDDRQRVLLPHHTPGLPLDRLRGQPRLEDVLRGEVLEDGQVGAAGRRACDVLRGEVVEDGQVGAAGEKGV